MTAVYEGQRSIMGGLKAILDPYHEILSVGIEEFQAFMINAIRSGTYGKTHHAGMGQSPVI